MAKISLAETLGRTIRVRRKLLGLTQAELADFAGVSLRTVTNLEKGKATVRIDVVMPVLDAIGLELIVTPRVTA